METIAFAQNAKSFDKLGPPGDEFFKSGRLVVELDGDFLAHLAVVFRVTFDLVRKENGFFDGEVLGKTGFAGGALEAGGFVRRRWLFVL